MMSEEEERPRFITGGTGVNGLKTKHLRLKLKLLRNGFFALLLQAHNQPMNNE